MEKKTIDMLTKDSVSIMTTKYIIDNGVEYQIGTPHRCAYVNSVWGRQQLVADVPEPYRSAVMAVWGDTPTITDSDSDVDIMI